MGSDSVQSPALCVCVCGGVEMGGEVGWEGEERGSSCTMRSVEPLLLSLVTSHRRLF